MPRNLRRLLVIVFAAFVGAVVLLFLSFAGIHYSPLIEVSGKEFYEQVLFVMGIGAIIGAGIAVHAIREMDNTDRKLRKDEEEYQRRKSQKQP